MTTGRRREIAVLCACATRRAQLSGLAPFDAAGFDWTALLQLATAHGVAELLTAPLSLSTMEVPPAILADLKRRELEATGLNLNRTTQVVDVLALLAAHQIRALTYKGPALAQGVYGHLGRRVSNDIDILVDRRDVSRVRPLLLAHGYRLPAQAPRRGGSLLYGLLPSTGRDDTLLPGRPGQTSVDVHVTFAYWTLGIRLDTDAMRDRACTVGIAGHAVPTLCPEDLLLALAIHGMMHSWHALRLVSDVDAVMDLVSDWDAVVRRAEEARMARVLWVALLLAKQVLGASLPSAVDARASRDRGAREIVQATTLRMFDPASVTTPWNHRVWLLAFLDGPLRRLDYRARTRLEKWVLLLPWDAWLGRREAKGA
jgi:hypothetical protein